MYLEVGSFVLNLVPPSFYTSAAQRRRVATAARKGGGDHLTTGAGGLGEGIFRALV